MKAEYTIQIDFHEVTGSISLSKVHGAVNFDEMDKVIARFKEELVSAKNELCLRANESEDGFTVFDHQKP